MQSLISINYDNPEHPAVSGRGLHAALCIKTAYKDWFPRMCEYGFEANKDYFMVAQKRATNNPKNPYTTLTDHLITIPMAKELCMIQRTPLGKEFRKYFISVEEMWNSPDMVMQRALTIANARVKELQLQNSQLTLDNQLMKPKADYFDALVDSNLLTNLRDTASEFHIRQKDFITYLLDNKYLYRTQKNELRFYSTYGPNGKHLFDMKEFSNRFSGHSGTQIFVTPKGREAFRLILSVTSKPAPQFNPKDLPVYKLTNRKQE